VGKTTSFQGTDFLPGEAKDLLEIENESQQIPAFIYGFNLLTIVIGNIQIN